MRSVDVWLELVVVLVLANAAPIVLKRLLGPRWASPLDRGCTLRDGTRLLGASKTARGFVVGTVTAGLAAAVLGLGVRLGLLLGALSMAGDAASSFVKRRLKMPPGRRALGLDQIPEAFAPAAACHWLLGIGWGTVALVTVAFAAAELVISRLDYRYGVGDHPY